MLGLGNLLRMMMMMMMMIMRRRRRSSMMIMTRRRSLIMMVMMIMMGFPAMVLATFFAWSRQQVSLPRIFSESNLQNFSGFD